MSRLQNHPDALLAYRQNNGPTLSSEVMDRLGISRSTLSRRMNEIGGDKVIRIVQPA
jgi:DNA-binding Lrp family transcriptional regulator